MSKLLKVGGVALLVLFLGAVAGVYYLERTAERIVHQELRKLENLASVVADVNHGSVRVDIWRRKLVVRGVHIVVRGQDDYWKIGALVVDDLDPRYLVKAGLKMLDPKKDAPHSLGFKALGVEIPLEKLPLPHLRLLTAMGYRQLNLDLMTGYRFDQAQQTFKVHAKVLSRGMAELGFELEYADFDFAQMVAATREKNAAVLAMASVKRGELKFVDHSLFSRLNWFVYQKSKTTLPYAFKTYRQRRMVRAGFGARIPANASEPQIYDTVAKFLENPRSLSVVASPPQPVAMMRLAMMSQMEPEEIVRVLNLDLVANR